MLKLQESAQLGLARLSVKFRRPTRQPRRVAVHLSQRRFFRINHSIDKKSAFFSDVVLGSRAAARGLSVGAVTQHPLNLESVGAEVFL